MTSLTIIRAIKAAPHSVFEGPKWYFPVLVAVAFARARGKAIELQVNPQDEWVAIYRKLGFSEPAAQSHPKITKVSVEGGFTMTADPMLDSTTLQDYIDALAARSKNGNDIA